MTTNFPETDIETPTAPPPPLVKQDGRIPGGARRPDLNPTGVVHPEVVSDYNEEVIEGVKNPPGAHDGLLKDGTTGHLIGIEQAPFTAHPEVGSDYPKWVTPHASHVSMADNVGFSKPESGDFDTDNEIAGRKATDKSKVKTEDGQLFVPRGSVVSVPGFEHHVRRHDGALMVLVHDEDEEKFVMGESSDAKPGDGISPIERYHAETAYLKEVEKKNDEARNKRIAEIVVERRQQEIKQREKNLEDDRKAVEAIKSGRTAGSEPHRSEMFEVQPPTKYQGSLDGRISSTEELDRERHTVGEEKSVADSHDRPGMSGQSEADSKIGPDDWTTRSGPVEVSPDKPFGNQGQK
jgi:hypothetical protein